MAVVDWRVAAPLIHQRAWFVALFLGLSIAVAATARVDCKDQNLLLDGGGRLMINANGALLLNGPCELRAGPYRIPLPSWLPSSWAGALRPQRDHYRSVVGCGPLSIGNYWRPRQDSNLRPLA